jgi:hypothetical protein
MKIKPFGPFGLIIQTQIIFNFQFSINTTFHGGAFQNVAHLRNLFQDSLMYPTKAQSPQRK